MSFALSDVGEGAVLPAWVSELGGAGVDIDHATVEWIKKSDNLFYAWHWYGDPSDPADAVKNVRALSKKWDLPSFLTEFMSCDAWHDAEVRAEGASRARRALFLRLTRDPRPPCV